MNMVHDVVAHDLQPGQLVVVVGAGVSGLAATRLLHRLGARVRLLDRKSESIPHDFAVWAQSAGIEILCGDHSPAQFTDATLIIPSPGVAAAVIRKYLPGRHDDPPIMAETELAWRQLTGEPVLGITGTSGKTTTTSLCAAMLEAAGLNVFTGGNIGTPLSQYVLDVMDGAPKVDVVVLELSSFQLQTCSTLRPKVGVLLNVSENHLDFHADMDEYISAKMNLFAHQTASDIAVIHRDLELFGSRYRIASKIELYDVSDRFPDMQLLGPHNKANAEAAWRACQAFGVTEAQARSAAAAFAPLPHRLERVAEHNNIMYVNDSKCTTIAALRVALNAFDRPVILLAGGKFKGGDVEGLLPVLKEKVRCITLYGGSREHFEPVWNRAVPVTWDETLERATHRAVALAQPGDVILLAPATSSYDQYPNYLRRGEDFRRIVHEVMS